MIVNLITDKYIYWIDKNDFVLTRNSRNREVVCRGSFADCKHFENLHPYGVTLKQLETL